MRQINIQLALTCRVETKFWYPKCLPRQWELRLNVATTHSGTREVLEVADAYIDPEGFHVSPSASEYVPIREVDDKLQFTLAQLYVPKIVKDRPKTEYTPIRVKGTLSFSGGPNLDGKQTVIARAIDVEDAPDNFGIWYNKSRTIE